MSRIFTPKDGWWSRLLAPWMGSASRQEEGTQVSGGEPARGASYPITADTALKLSVVWACIRLNAEALGAMPPRIYERSKANGTKQPLPDHWFNELFHVPNSTQTWNEFVETMVINLLLAGNSYNRVGRNGSGAIRSLRPMVAPQTEVVFNGSTRRYEFTTGDTVTTLTQDRCWHIPLMPSNGIVGLSPIQYGARAMGIAIGEEDRVSTLAANGFKSTGVVSTDQILTPDQRVKIREQYKDLQEGQGDPLKVLEAGMKFQAISITPKDAQLIEGRQFQVEDLCRFYGVPSVLVNDSQGTTQWGTGVGEIKEGWYTFGLQPLTKRIEAGVPRWLLPAEERGKVFFEFDVAEFLRGNFAQQVETLTKAVSGKLLTINEARALRGLEPVEWGDNMYDQSQMIPLGSEPEEQPEPTEDDDAETPED